VRGRPAQESSADQISRRVFRGLWREIDRRKKARASHA
jgi:hypothetical protein